MKGLQLACSSDRSTIHIFSVNVKLDQPNNAIKLSDEEGKIEDEPEGEGGDRPRNNRSRWGFIRGIVPYFDSEWSYGKFKVPGDSNQKCKCAFSQDSQHLIVVSNDGKYYKAMIPKSNGNCKVVETHNLM